MHLKISSAKWWPFCPRGNELMHCKWPGSQQTHNAVQNHTLTQFNPIILLQRSRFHYSPHIFKLLGHRHDLFFNDFANIPAVQSVEKFSYYCVVCPLVGIFLPRKASGCHYWLWEATDNDQASTETPPLGVWLGMCGHSRMECKRGQKPKIMELRNYLWSSIIQIMELYNQLLSSIINYGAP